MTCWGRTSTRFLVQGKSTYCGCWYCSFICSGGYIFCSRGDWQFKLIVSVDSGPKCRRYSPIRAELWSCGQVLLYLAREGNEDNLFGVLTRKLLNKTPRLRPLLHRLPWLHQQSSFKVGHSLSESQGTMKRKSDTLPHDAKRLAIGTVHPR